ncbi:MAG: hypothetical protein JRE63_10695 [Deltaproteobacteria bacterium]|jgi:c-di-GMP-binding flagellar brake protein YcgR|nr:hypothetical protein [Deltaproteobacteria bacterium]
MIYSKYFIRGQKVFIKRAPQNTSIKTTDTLTGYVTRSHNMQLELTLPYGTDAAESYPFRPGMIFELMTEHSGMGLRLTARFFEKTSQKDIHFHLDSNLEFISRRIYRRLDVNGWVGYKRNQGTLLQMQRAWRENQEKIESGINPEQLTAFEKYPLNLAGGGIRMPLRAPVHRAELILLFLSIGDKQGIICALSEVVWVGDPQDDGTVYAGLRFLMIREKDQARIDTVVKTLIKRLDGLAD